MSGEWGSDWGENWGGLVYAIPKVHSFILHWDDENDPGVLGPHLCRAALRPIFENDPPGHALCFLFPEYMCITDLNPDLGGTGDWHRLLAIIYDLLFGSRLMTGIMDDIASFICIIDPEDAPSKFLDALLLHYGFDIPLPLTDPQKRRILLALIELYRRKGTEIGIENALRIILEIETQILPLNGRTFDFFECGEEASLTLTPVDSTSDYVEVQNPERFEVGPNLVIIDQSGGAVDFEDTPITAITSNRVFFAPQTLSGTIPVGAFVFCDRLCDQVEDETAEGGCAVLGPDGFDPTDTALWTFYVDIEKTVLTVTELEDGDTTLEVDDVTFIRVGGRVRIASTVTVTVRELDVDAKVLTFDPVSLSATIPIGSEVLNVFNAEELALISRIVDQFKPAHTHHVLTRDGGDAAAEVG